MFKDVAQLWNVPVSYGDSTYSFIMDTGAGFSTISTSYAKKLALDFVSDRDILIVSGVTGAKTAAKIGIARYFKMGKIQVKNAVFLVFPDSSLSFAGGQYNINGILGAPILMELGCLTFSSSSLAISAPSIRRQKPNFFMDLLTPVVYLVYQGKTLPFTFDTGAQTSVMSERFYQLDSTRVNLAGKAVSKSYGGVGGQRLISGVVVPEIKVHLGNIPILLQNVFISKNPLPVAKSVYYGNVGRDLLQGFTKITIDFKNAWLGVTK